MYDEEFEFTELDAEELADRAANIKLVLTDVDGVLTDTGVYYGANGEELKRFSIRDGMGVELLREQGIETAFCTRENTPTVKSRSEKLKLKYYFPGIQDKAEFLPAILEQTGLEVSNIAYIGDDVNDLGIIRLVRVHGLTGAPGDGIGEVLEEVNHVGNVRAGHGAFRAFADWIMELRQVE
jgi:3-deoxy-D-manno-octulosonate 8-phosphate phosphatase (KDO 8-P phosphatase)